VARTDCCDIDGDAFLYTISPSDPRPAKVKG
jgi:hypothetical protein